MEKLSIENFKEYESNPFLEKIYEHDIIQKKDGTRLTPTNIRITDNNNSLISAAYVKQRTSKYIDSREFVRITDNGIENLASLKHVEFKIFCFVLLQLTYNDLEINLNVNKIKDYFGYKSRNPIYQGIIGLLEKDFISRKKKGNSIYFINPMYFYKGTIVKEVFGYINTISITNRQTVAIRNNISN